MERKEAMVDLKMLAEAVIQGDAKECARLTLEGLDGGLTSQILLNDGSTAGMAILRPRLTETGAKPVGKAVMGTVGGDLHDIGKNIVSMMLEGAGFQVTNLGVDAAPERFIQAIKEQEPQIIGMSALLTTTMRNMEEIIEALKTAGLREKVRVMVGGAPVTRRFADEIGADGYAEDAASAVEKARGLLVVH